MKFKILETGIAGFGFKNPIIAYHLRTQTTIFSVVEFNNKGLRIKML